MKNQQQAEREEQQRIKNLVLNYDLRENEDQDGDPYLLPLSPNKNIHNQLVFRARKANIVSPQPIRQIRQGSRWTACPQTSTERC
jgi:hypothetical protein